MDISLTTEPCMMWIDSHCHLDAIEFAQQQADLINKAGDVGVQFMVIPAVHRTNFLCVQEIAHAYLGCVYALGIHPMYVKDSTEEDLLYLRKTIEGALEDKKLVAIGEIGLDFFVEEISQGQAREKQIYFYQEQLKMAREFNLPVLLHVRRSVDMIQKYLRQISVVGGIAHAFNGSVQQAQIFIDLGFKLGFGGAMTYPRALQLRRLASTLPIESIVLETDAPDIAPVWLTTKINVPAELPQIGHVLATLRNRPVKEIAKITSKNVCAVLPRLSVIL
jgi:TatD DNase family protein